MSVNASLLALFLLLLGWNLPIIAAAAGFTCSSVSGFAYLGGCYFHAINYEDSCTVLCKSLSMPYDSRTLTVIGSQGSLAACNDVLVGLNFGSGTTTASSFIGAPIGCVVYNGREWHYLTPTTADGTFGSSNRVCACTCPTGSYQLPNGDCAGCAANCGTCAINSTNCLTCASGYYGSTCQYLCSTCGIHGTCSQGITGSCACQVGWDGPDCQICAANAYGSTCTLCSLCEPHGTCTPGLPGSCLCDLGWNGPQCDRCTAGFYGGACLPCSGCLGVCYSGSGGNCSCPTGTAGLICEVCASGYFKPSSSSACLPCSTNCNECLETATACENCMPGYYGANCSLSCTSCDVHGACTEGVDGFCECSAGWQGPDCRTATQTAFLGITLYVITGCLVALYLCAAIIYARMIRSKSQHLERKHMIFLALRLPTVFVACFDLVTDIFFAWNVSLTLTLMEGEREAFLAVSIIFLVFAYLSNLGVALVLTWKDGRLGIHPTPLLFSIVAATSLTADFHASETTCLTGWRQFAETRGEKVQTSSHQTSHSGRTLLLLWLLHALGEDVPQLIMQCVFVTRTSAVNTITTLSIMASVLSIVLGSISFLFFTLLPSLQVQKAPPPSTKEYLLASDSPADT